MMARVGRWLVAGMVALLGGLAVSATPAGAAIGYEPLCPSLKTVLCKTGGDAPLGVAVDNSSGSSSGDVWVAYEFAVAKFDSSGNELLGGVLSKPAGYEETLRQVAVDPSSGDVYVSAKGVVTKLNSAGEPLLTITETPRGAIEPFGLAVNPSSGDLYVADGAHENVDVFTPAGAYVESLEIPATGSMAIDAHGNLYVGFEEGGEEALRDGIGVWDPFTAADVKGEVREYSSAGSPVDCPDGSNALVVEARQNGLPVAVDPTNGHVFVGEVTANGKRIVIGAYSSICATAPSAELFVSEQIAGNGYAGSDGIGVNAATGSVYYGDGNPIKQLEYSVQIDAAVPTPEVTTGVSVTDVTPTSAVVSGTVNPEGLSVTTCEFEYGETTAYGSSVPCSQPLPLEGSAPIPVSAELKYPRILFGHAEHYRLKAGSAAGASVGADEAIVRGAAPVPVIAGQPASNVSQFAATLNATLETGEALVNYHFEYGTSTSYGQLAPIPDGYTPPTSEPVAVSQPLQGLQAGTTYHYRLVASSPGGTEVKGPDETFTTLPVPPPTVSTGAAEDVGVGGATLTGTIDPHGWNTEYLFEYGTTTAYGSSWPTIEVEMGALEGSQPVVVSIPSPQLLPGTTYHYRLVATNGGGTTYGPDMTLTTGTYPVEPIQEPVALKTLLVPSEPGIVVTTTKKAKKKSKKIKKRRKAHKTAKHGKAKKAARRRR
jgi:hypothetical protein